jgi:hypothetical protein
MRCTQKPGSLSAVRACTQHRHEGHDTQEQSEQAEESQRVLVHAGKFPVCNPAESIHSRRNRDQDEYHEIYRPPVMVQHVRPPWLEFNVSINALALYPFKCLPVEQRFALTRVIDHRPYRNDSRGLGEWKPSLPRFQG